VLDLDDLAGGVEVEGLLAPRERLDEDLHDDDVGGKEREGGDCWQSAAVMMMELLCCCFHYTTLQGDLLHVEISGKATLIDHSITASTIQRVVGKNTLANAGVASLWVEGGQSAQV